MTEAISIADIERENAPQQARAKAVMSLNLAGMPSADADTVSILHGEFPELGEMEGLLVSYTRGVGDIINGDELDTEAREEAYEALVERVEPAFEEAAKKLERAVVQRRKELQHALFGHAHNTPLASPEAKHAAQLNYRDALYTAANAKNSELEDHMSLAEATGDKVLMKAVATIADQRGMKELVYRYLSDAGEKTFEKYVRRNSLPTESTIGALISAYRPERVARGSLAPNQHAVQAKREREARQNTRRAQLFKTSGGR